MDLTNEKCITQTGSYVCGNQKNDGQADTKTKNDPQTKNRRGGRRARRLAMQQENVLSTASTAAASKSPATAVVTATSDAKKSSGDKCPVNSTSVRRRAKPANTVVKKVVTGVSLDALRAKRNGTYTENTPGSDAKTIEEVSRILFMYASRQHHGSTYNLPRRCGSCADDGACSSANTELETHLGTLDVAVTPSKAAATNEVHVDKPSFLGRGFADIRDVYDHLLSMVLSGKLPAESLDVLHAILPYTSRGGKSCAFDNKSKCWGYNGVWSGAAAKEGGLQQPWLPPMSGMQGYMSQPFQSQQQQVNPFAMEESYGCGDYSLYTEPVCFSGMNFSENLPAFNFPSTGVDNVVPEYACDYPFFGGHVFQNQQVQESNCHGLPKGSDARVSGEYERCDEIVLQSAVKCDDDENNNDNKKNNDDNNDEDEDVTAILHDIQNVMQHVLSQQKLCHSSSQCEDLNFDSDGTFSSMLPTPCVTISQAERETLRSVQKEFLARMRVTGSPESRTFGLTSSEDFLHTFVSDNEFGGLVAEQEQEKDDEGRYAINRTLFSYHSAFLSEGDGDDKAVSDGHVVGDAFLSPGSTITTAAAAVPRQDESIQYPFYRFDSSMQETGQQQQQQQQLLPDNNDASVSEAQTDNIFAVLGGLLKNEKGISMVAEVASGATAEKKDQFGSCVIHTNKWNRTKPDNAGGAAAIITAPLTPYRQWFGGSGCAENCSLCVTTTTPCQPTTQKKRLSLWDDRSPYSSAACDLAASTRPAACAAAITNPVCDVQLTNTMTKRQEQVKTNTTSFDQDAVPFVLFEVGE